MITNENGDYVTTVPAGWSGEIVPMLESYAFTPEKRVYTHIQSNAIDQDFTATYSGNYTITGFIKNQEGNPVEGVILQGFPGSIVTNANGQYAAEVPSGWTGEITPVLTGHTFEPASRNYSTVAQHYNDQDYTSVVISSTEWNKPLTLDIYPNPTSGVARINLNEVLTESGWCIISGNDGREVVRLELHPGTSSLLWNTTDRSGTRVSSGIYHCRIFSGRRSVATGKIVVLGD